ncbi:Helix-turn-helix domain-containing protein [Curtobacterium sp. UNCCL20]|uniref:helix-turn-helix domain-containing protein n=1 Tax=Curtobacterium sp. UNCCL20 TaxID=1502773 RepID=UPI00088D0145|nr:helix-turn-helix transcriptional regulator [Curtobacterium sp. UNCCL20]SDQ63491.1 Helix-turn-helix domain-containing protein [Curtobacterium sp. UNCCL20]
MADNALGDYLRARRGAVRPSDVGLRVDGNRRRVVGLRREEVAVLAGISAEYYLRLEQGRERHPSDQVVRGLAVALLLGPSSEEFLHRLVRDRGRATDRAEAEAERLGVFVRALTAPAFVHDRVLGVVASNALARALSPAFSPGVNLMTAAFEDDALRDLYVNWEEMTVRLVSYLRVQAEAPPLDPRLPELVLALSERSPRFAALWARQDVDAPSSGVNRLEHPAVGPLELRFERLCVAGSDHPVVVVYHAEPGSQSEAALALLGSVVGPAAPVPAPRVPAPAPVAPVPTAPA